MQVKKNLRQLGFDPETIRRVSIAMYEGEINMVIHAGGGTADVTVDDGCIEIILSDTGPVLQTLSRLCRRASPQRPIISALSDSAQVWVCRI